MKLLRGIIGGVVVGVIGEVIAFLIYGVIFNKWVVMTMSLWRPMDSLYWRVGMPLVDIFNGLMLALGYALLYKGIPGTGLKKGLAYGLIIWLITRVAGELFMYVMIPYPFELVVAGWIHGIIALLLGGLVLAAIYGRSLE